MYLLSHVCEWFRVIKFVPNNFQNEVHKKFRNLQIVFEFQNYKDSAKQLAEMLPIP